MRTKHTFLFTLILGLAWAGYLFSSAMGPITAGLGGVNGVFGANITCNQSLCHSGNPLNASGGFLILDGLPTQWTPGATYPLTVQVQRTAVTYGFQLSAVFDSTSPPRQAGALTKGAPSGTTDFNRIEIKSDGAIQYAEHSATNQFLAPTNTFFVNWTAPSTADGGIVRFNLAGNAANGDRDNIGDFIYTRVDKVSPLTAPPDFSIAAASPSASIVAGTSTAVSFNATGSNGFSGSVNFTVGGLPPCGVAASFDPASIQAGGSSTLTITTVAGATTGVFPLTITASSGSLVHTTSLTVTITPPGNTTQTFSISNLSGASFSTNGGCDGVTGYVRIQQDPGNTTPSGVEFFAYTKNNILVSETGVPASPLLTQGRIYAEENGPVQTGIAIANPNGQAANIQFFYTDAGGTSTAPQSLSIPANSQIAGFLSQAPFSLGAPFQGSFSFTSDMNVSVIALRGLTNEDGNFLMSTLPVIDTAVLARTGTQVLPHFATGDGWTTQVFLVNPGTTALAGNLQFVDENGAPVNVLVQEQTVNTAAYSVASRSAQKFVVSGPKAGGSIRVVPAGGGAVPTSIVLFSQKRSSGVTATEAAASVSSGTAFRMYVETSTSSEGSIDSGIAVANTTSGVITVRLDLFNLDGSPAAAAKDISQQPMRASAKAAAFVSQLFPGLPQPFKGILRISSAANISVAGLRTRVNQRPDFLITTTPIALEAAAASTAEMLFPHLANGGGYVTQFILFSGISGQASSGTLRFLKTDGAPLSLSLNN